MTATDFLTDRKLRDEYIPHTEVLDKIKVLHYIPETQYFTMNQLAEYYEVPLDTIDSCYKLHSQEVDMDGVVLMTPKTYKESLTVNASTVKSFIQHHGKMEIFVDEDTSIIIPNRGIKVFPKRASLRIGMLLTQSAVAEQVRTLMLDICMGRCAPMVEDITSTNEIDLFVNCVQAKTSEERLKACYAFSRYKDIQILQKDAEIAQLKEQMQTLKQLQLTTSDKPHIKAKKVYGSKEVETMRRRFSKVVRMAAKEMEVPYGVVYDAVYELLEEEYSISLRDRRDRDPKEMKIVMKEQQGISVNHIPMIKYLEDDEWEILHKCVVKYLESSGFDSDEIIKKVRNADKKKYKERTR